MGTDYCNSKSHRNENLALGSRCRKTRLRAWAGTLAGTGNHGGQVLDLRGPVVGLADPSLKASVILKTRESPSQSSMTHGQHPSHILLLCIPDKRLLCTGRRQALSLVHTPKPWRRLPQEGEAYRNPTNATSSLGLDSFWKNHLQRTFGDNRL